MRSRLFLFLPVIAVAAAILAELRPVQPAGPLAPVPTQTHAEAALSAPASPGLRIVPRPSADPASGADAVPEARSASEWTAKVAGKIWVNGHEPRQPIEIWIDRWFYAQSRTWTDDAGRFEFRGLPEDWYGSVVLPNEYALEGPRDENASAEGEPDERDRPIRFRVMPFEYKWDAPVGWKIALNKPESTLEIRLVERPAIKGRLLRGDDVLRATGRVQQVGARFISSWSFRCDWASGRFCIPVKDSAEEIKIWVSDEFGMGSRVIELNGPFQGIRDLGDLVLSPTYGVAFRVRDSVGRPIRDAQAVAAGTTSNSGPTDEEGRGRLILDTQVDTIVVGAIGYAATEVTVPDDASQLVEVMLPLTNQLIVETRLADGSRAGSYDGIYVNLISRQSMAGSNSDSADVAYWAAGATQSIYQANMGDGANYACGHKPDSSGRVLIVGLAPGTDIRVQLRSIGLDELLDEITVAMGAAGVETLTLQAPEPSTFEGVVRTEDGHAVAGATVFAIAVGGQSDGETIATDSDGRFRIKRVFASQVRLAISKDGFEDRDIDRVTVVPLGDVRSFVLVAK